MPGRRGLPVSATGRGGMRKANDFYETPEPCTLALLPFLPPGPVLDPCCGDRAILRVMDADGRAPNRGMDVDPARAADVWCDALAVPWGWASGLVVTNPPYSLAEKFVRKALAEVGHRGTVAMLLRLPFLESLARVDLHAKHPSDVLIFAKRPSFTGDGKTDATAYAWFVWGPGRGGRWAVLT